MYGQGISREGEILDAAVKLDIIEKSGSWFSYNGSKIGQGRDNAKEFCRRIPSWRGDRRTGYGKCGQAAELEDRTQARSGSGSEAGRGGRACSGRGIRLRPRPTSTSKWTTDRDNA